MGIKGKNSVAVGEIKSQTVSYGRKVGRGGSEFPFHVFRTAGNFLRLNCCFSFPSLFLSSQERCLPPLNERCGDQINFKNGRSLQTSSLL